MAPEAAGQRAAAVVVAAGRGTRAGGGIAKQWRPLGGRTAVAHSVTAFMDHPAIVTVVLVVHPDDLQGGYTHDFGHITLVTGGATRSASVLAGLQALTDDITHALVHDAARPCVSRSVIDGVLAALQGAAAAAPAVAVTDALWTGAEGVVTGTVDRRGLYRAQTPQGFALPAILAAHRDFPDGADDDVALARRAGHKVVITPGSADNIKITTPEDFARAERILRTGHGHQTGKRL